MDPGALVALIVIGGGILLGLTTHTWTQLALWALVAGVVLNLYLLVKITLAAGRQDRIGVAVLGSIPAGAYDAVKIFLLGFLIQWGVNQLRSPRHQPDPWPAQQKAAYVDRCAVEMAPQVPPQRDSRTICQCLADSLEAEFGVQEYQAMMAAQPDPKGSKSDRRLYRVASACIR